MNHTLLCFYRYFLLFMLAVSFHGYAEQAETFVRLPGHVPSRAIANAAVLKDLGSDKQIKVTLMLPLRNRDTLDKLVQSIYDYSDQEHYGKYLTPEEFIERFAPIQADYDKVVNYAKQLGLTVSGIHPNRILVNAEGSAKTIEKSFNLKLSQYQLANGRKFYAPNKDPEVPVSIASLITGIVGLDNHAVWHPFHRRKHTAEVINPSIARSNAFPSGPGGGFSPNDLITAYNLTQVSGKGSGQIIALFELASYQTSDINEYTNYFGLPSAKLTNVLVDGGSGGRINAEVTLDVALALALAPASKIYVYEGPNSNQGVLNTYNRIATDNLAKQVSTSWGLGENFVMQQFLDAEYAIFQQMAVQGQTIYAAAGDSGAYDDYSNNGSTALVVDDPASQPYVVAVGGTTLHVDSLTGARLSESVWNDGLGNGAGGGGVSSVWPIPSWQSNVSTVYSKTYRNIPDVSLNADPNTGYSIFFNGSWQIYGGTSCAAPLWAAFTSLVNQNLAATNQPALGFANPILYHIGTGGSYTTDFFDITSGNNLYYSATVGYDNASGWGSFNGAQLLHTLTNSSPTTTPEVLPTINK